MIMIKKQKLDCAISILMYINGFKTDWFTVDIGLKQGYLISPMLFTLYINDLTKELKEVGLGVKVGDDLDCVYSYADAIVLIAETEDQLQEMLNVLSIWYQKWKICVNVKKTQVVHFRRGPSVPKTDYVFTCGEEYLNVID